MGNTQSIKSMIYTMPKRRSSRFGCIQYKAPNVAAKAQTPNPIFATLLDDGDVSKAFIRSSRVRRNRMVAAQPMIMVDITKSTWIGLGIDVACVGGWRGWRSCEVVSGEACWIIPIAWWRR